MSIYLIKSLWVSPLENYNSDGYDVIGYVSTEQEAINYMESCGFYIGTGYPFKEGQKVQRIKYEKLEEIK